MAQQIHELLWRAHGQRAQDERVDHAEDRRVGADADRQRQDHDDREGTVSRETAQRMPRVTAEIREPGQPPLIPQRLHRLRYAAMPDSHRTRDTFVRLTRTRCALSRHLRVDSQLLPQIAVATCPAKHSGQTLRPLAKE
jgi:hypothetical protein